MKLILAQGNPGQQYQNSRHNVGFMVLNALTDSLEASWSEKPKLHATVSEVNINGVNTLLVKPTTYYNETGVSARKIADFFKISVSDDLLVIHDDLALPFGTIRVRKQGSDAGNNGIKSLNTHISPEFARIRVGTDNEMRSKMGDTDFVLGKFSSDEFKQLNDKIIPCVFEIIDEFCAGNIKETSYKV